MNAIKRVANYLGGKNYILSPKHQAERMLNSYKKQIKHTSTVQQLKDASHNHPEKRESGPKK